MEVCPENALNEIALMNRTHYFMHDFRLFWIRFDARSVFTLNIDSALHSHTCRLGHSQLIGNPPQGSQYHSVHHATLLRKNSLRGAILLHTTGNLPRQSWHTSHNWTSIIWVCPWGFKSYHLSHIETDQTSDNARKIDSEKLRDRVPGWKKLDQKYDSVKTDFVENQFVTWICEKWSVTWLCEKPTDNLEKSTP